jgi:hypothetical protein
MGFQIDPIQTNNPYPAGTAGGRASYQVHNTGPDDPGHQDHIQMWGSDGSQPVNIMETAPPSQAGGLYGVFIDIPPLNAGFYDLSVTLPDGTGIGTTVIVQ